MVTGSVVDLSNHPDPLHGGAVRSVSRHAGRDVDSLRAVRVWLRTRLDELTDLPAPVLAEAEVMVSELVTNVIRHTTSEADLTLVVTAADVRIEVHDDDRALPVLPPLEPSRVGGNGLRIVDAWSTSWGVAVDAGSTGKTVWFTLAL